MSRTTISMPRTTLSSLTGNAYTFDGTTGWVSTGSLGTYITGLSSNPFSIAFWAKFSTTSNAGNLCGFRNGSVTSTILVVPNQTSAGTNTAGFIDIFLRDDGNTTINVATTSSVSANSNTFHHFCITGTPATNTYQWYVDGLPVATSKQSANTPTNWADPGTLGLGIGARNGAGSGAAFVAATMDDVRLYTVILTAAEVALLNKGQNITRGLFRLFNFDNLNGTVAEDSSTNSTNGTRNGTITLATGAISLYRNIA